MTAQSKYNQIDSLVGSYVAEVEQLKTTERKVEKELSLLTGFNFQGKNKLEIIQDFYM